jgi:hypothetical protein
MSANHNTTEHYKKALLEALEKTLGVVQGACKIVGISRTTYYQYLKDDAEFKKAVDDIENIALDFAESQLHKQIQDGNTSATIFYLKTKGRNRGYIERQELTGMNGQPLSVSIKVIRNEEESEHQS